MEDYKEKYEQALENLKRIKTANKDNKELVDFIEYKYPELKESEDEGIRKAIFKALSKKDARDVLLANGIQVSDALAWLEKQGEQNIKMIQWKGDNLREVVEFTGKSPKFNEWFKTWDDYENYVHSHGNIFKLFCEDGSHYEVPEGAWIVKTPDGYNVASKAKYKQKIGQKPAWSEEDEQMFKLCASSVKTRYNDGLLTCNEYEQASLWLKSLEERYTWKPSDDEMDALSNALSLAKSCGKESSYDLRTLYEQLKKLRKE